MRTTWLVLAAAVALTACAPESSEFVATIDAANIDANPDDGLLRFVVEPIRLDLQEDGDGTLAIHLNAAPVEPVTIGITGISGVVTLDNSQLTFDADDFQTDRLLNVHAVSDNDADPESGVITLEGAGVVAAATVEVEVTDNDHYEIDVTPGSTDTPLTVDEHGMADLSVVLRAEPASQVLVEIENPDPTAVSLSTTQLNFDATDWNVAKTVTVHGVTDADTIHEDFQLRLYGNGLPDKFARVRLVDSDTLQIGVSSGTVNLTEGGASGALGVYLTQDPGTPVTVTLTADGDGFHLGSTQLSFSSQNYADVQNVAVIPDDDLDTLGEDGTITLVTGSLSRQVSVHVNDDDTQAILHTGGSTIALTEGGSTTINLSLAYQPQANTTVTVMTDDAGAVTATTSVLFTPTDYGQAHPITINAEQDNDLAPETAHLTLSGGGAPANVVLTVNVTEDDQQTIILNPNAVTVTEGTTSTQLTARLGFQPASTTNVTVMSNNAGIVVGATTQTLSFSTSNWAMPKAVQLSAPTDSNTTDEQATIDFAGGGATNSATATVDDTTVVTNYGWPTYTAGSTDVVDGGVAIAYKITALPATTLDKLGVFLETAGSNLKMGLYKDNGNLPGARVAASNAAVSSLAAPAATYVDFNPDVPLTGGDYWLVIRVENTSSIFYSASQTSRQCTKSMPNFTDIWPDPFGTSSCANSIPVLNLFAVTYQ